MFTGLEPQWSVLEFLDIQTSSRDAKLWKQIPLWDFADEKKRYNFIANF